MPDRRIADESESPGDALRTLMVEATSGQWSVVSGQ